MSPEQEQYKLAETLDAEAPLLVRDVRGVLRVLACAWVPVRRQDERDPEVRGVVDELRLMVFPVILVSGLRWHPETPDKIVLQRAEFQTFESGVVEPTYRAS